MIRFDTSTFRNAAATVLLGTWAVIAGAHTGADGGVHHGVLGELSHGEPGLALSALLGIGAVAAAAWFALRHRNARRARETVLKKSRD